MKCNTTTLMDAICDNFMKGINHGMWSPVFNQDGSYTTFCNFFVGSVSKSLNCLDLWPVGNPSPLLANQMFDVISSSPAWMKEADGKMAQYHANGGALVIAAQKDWDGHGHVCVIRPGQMIYSGHWNKSAPRVANIGKDVFIDKTCAYAFEKEPDYFVWIQSIGDQP